MKSTLLALLALPFASITASAQVAEGAPAASQRPPSTFDAGELEPMTLRYRVVVQGSPFGIATTELSRDGENWSASTALEAGEMRQSSEVRFTGDFTPITLRSSVPQGETEFGADLSVADGRVTGTMRMPPQMGGERQLDVEVPEGTLLSGMDALGLAASAPAVGDTIAFPLFAEQAGAVIQATFVVAGEESVTVPAGTFEAYRVEMTAGPQRGTLWLRAEDPHVVLRQEFVGQPVVIELESVEF